MEKPIQEKLYKTFKDNISSKHWLEKLPAISVLCNEFKVNAKTLRKVIDRLVEEGFVEVRHGTGTFIRSQSDNSQATMERILLIVPYMRGVFISSLVQKFMDYQQKMNAEITVFGYDDDSLEKSLPDVLKEWDRVAILLLKPSSPAIKRCLNEFKARGRLLALNTKISGVRSSLVTGDNCLAGEEAVCQLHSLGYNQIAFFKHHNVKSESPRLKGYRQGIDKSNLRYSKVVTYQFNAEYLENCFRKLIAQKEFPEVIIFGWHSCSALAKCVLMRINMKLAEKTKFLVFDPPDLEQEFGFYAMVQPLDAIVEKSLHLLLAKEWKCRTINIAAEFINYGERL